MILWKLLVLLNVLKNFLILILIKSSLDSWIFESWILILIILESWIFLMKLSLDSWIVLDSILKSFSWAFCHHLCYHQNTLNQSWFIIMKQWSLLLHSLLCLLFFSFLSFAYSHFSFFFLSLFLKGSIVLLSTYTLTILIWLAYASVGQWDVNTMVWSFKTRAYLFL